MAYIDKNGIQFNSFDSNASAFKKKISNTQYAGASVDDLGDIANDNGGVLPTTINSVEIDWNGMVLDNGQVINTTGDFASYTSTASTTAAAAKKTADNAAADIIQINNKITNELASVNYVNERVAEAVAGKGTVAAIKINGNTKNPVSGVVDLGTVITTHQDISGKADKTHTHTKAQITDFPSIPEKVSDLSNDLGFTSNTGTITGIKMNGTSKGSSGVVDLGTVITAHQDISGKADKTHTHTKAQIIDFPSIPEKVSDLSNDLGFTSNTGTITGIKMNGASKGTSGVVDLGTVVTSELDPIFKASAAAGITSTNISNWNTTASNVSSLTTTTNTLSKNYIKGIKLHSSYYYAGTDDLANILDLTNKVYHKSVVYTKWEVENRLAVLRKDITALNNRCDAISSSQNDDYNSLYSEIIALQQRVAKLENGVTLKDPSISVSVQNVSGSYYNGADLIKLSISGVDEYDYLDIKPSIPLDIVNDYGNGYEYEDSLGTSTSVSLEFMYNDSATLYLGKTSDNSTMSGKIYITSSQTDTYKSFSKEVAFTFTNK